MTKTLTEQYKNKELSGWYYVKTKDGSINHWLLFTDTIEFEKDIEEVLGPVPDYMDYKGLIYDSINLANARKRIDELVSKTEQLEKQLKIATKALKGVCLWANTGNGGEKAVKKVCEKALKEMEGVK